MTYVVVELCVDCKYTDCAAVCPVEAFHELPDRLYINPDTCIDCDACVPECPVEAIFADTTLPDNWSDWLGLNAEAENYPTIKMDFDTFYKSKYLDVYDIYGRLLQSFLIGKYNNQFSMSNYSCDLYLYQLRSKTDEILGSGNFMVQY